MKAVIMAGGAGTRLRPLSCGEPKPMVPLFDKPVMEYIIELLKKHAITDITVTLQFMPERIMEYFGDGSAFGVCLRYSVEKEPLGTAGSVRASGICAGGEDFLIISGDAVCDIDLGACIAFHESRQADATLVLYRSETPLEYGLVMTDEQGRIRRFIEKPYWGQVFTDTVNTGIYILSGRAMQRVPTGKTFDFAKDLFPVMLRDGARLYGVAGDGYWCDIGDTGAYLRCVADVLSGKVLLSLPAAQVLPGLWSASPAAESANIITPCYIGKNVHIGEEALIGPYVALCAGSRVGNQALVQHSAVNGAQLGQRSTVFGCTVCAGAVIGSDATIDRGCVVGKAAVIGDGAVLCEDVRIWPEKQVPAGAHVEGGVAGTQTLRTNTFDEEGSLTGTAESDLTPDYCLRFGLAVSGCLTGEIGIARAGGEAAKACALAFEAGVRATGGSAVRFDADSAPAAAFAARYLGFAGSVFFSQQESSLTVFLYGGDGLKLSRQKMRMVETLLTRGEFSRAPAAQFGCGRSLSGVGGAYAAAASAAAFELLRTSFVSGLKVSVEGIDALSESMRQALVQTGCRLAPAGRGAPALFIAQGSRLAARDENCAQIAADRLLVLRALLELENGSAAVAVGSDAPAEADKLTATGGRILRAGRDGAEADRLYAEQPYMRDCVFGAARLCAGLMRAGKTLGALNAQVPSFFTVTRQAELKSDRARVMREMDTLCAGEDRQLYEGLHVRLRQGAVRVLPHFSRSALLITGEGASEEIAQELCALFEKRAEQADTAPEKK